MAWIKVESSVSRNPKFLKAGPAASWLWLCGLAYCQEGLTDGYIPFEALSLLGVIGQGKTDPRRLAMTLVLCGLWEAVESGGWRVHDYLKHNRSAVEVQDLRTRRAEGGNLGGRPTHNLKGFTEGNLPDKTEHNLPGNPSTATATTTETSPPAEQRQRLAPLVAKRRKDAAFEGPRVYVPQRIHSDFLALRGVGSEGILFAWYEVVSDQWSIGDRKTDEPGADMFLFWKSRYAERWPAAASISARSNGPEWLQNVRKRQQEQS